MDQHPQQSPEGFTSEDEEATYCLSLLRDGDRHQKIVARDRLSQIFERRGMLDEAAQCIESNIREGVRDPRVYQRLSGVYRRQGRHELADEVLLEARRLAERLARSQPPAARRPGPGRPGPGRPPAAGPVRPAGPPPGALDAPTINMPAAPAPAARPPEPAVPSGFGPSSTDDFGSEAPTIGMGSSSEVAPAREAGAINRPWYVSPAMVVLLLLLCGPYGLALMWVQGGYAHATKVRVASVWAGLMVLVLAGIAVTLPTQIMPLLTAGASSIRGLPGAGVQSTPIVFGTPPAAGTTARPTMPSGLAPSPPAVVVSPGALPSRPNSTIIGTTPTAEPSAAPKPAEPSPAPPAAKPAGEQVRVKEGANLRERPGQAAPVVKTVPEGTILQVVGGDQPMDGMTWKNVRDESGAQGWMAAELLEPAP